VRTISREQRRDGAFQRRRSTFGEWVRADGRGGPPAEYGRYHLYVAKACPWASRALIVRRLKRLEHAISVCFAHPLRDDRGWAFPGPPFTDDLNGFDVLAEAYERSDPEYDARDSVPVLWDKHKGRIVNNESADIVRMLNREFDEWGDDSVDLIPPICAGRSIRSTSASTRRSTTACTRPASRRHRRPTTARSATSSSRWARWSSSSQRGAISRATASPRPTGACS
jgi:glutathionyl-hydroquinone reductase